MHDAATPAARSRDRWFLIGALAVTVAVLTGLTGYLFYLQSQLQEIVARDLRIEHITGDIRQLDELLTMSARLCAATGDFSWEDRYLRHVGELDRTIKEAASLVAEDASAEFTARTDVANQKLVALELRAFELVRSRRKDEALRLLTSGEYAEQKEFYAAGVATLLEAMHQQMELTRSKHARRTNVAGVASASATLLLVFFWIQVGSSLKRYRAAQTQAETRQHASDARFRQLAGNTDQGVWFFQIAPPRLLYVNPAVERIWGLTAEEFYRQPDLWLQAIVPDDQDHVRSIHDACIQSKGSVPYTVEYRIIRPDGTVRWIHDRGVLLSDSAGNPIQLSGIAEDITVRKQAQTDMAALNAELTCRTGELSAALIKAERASDIQKQLVAILEASPDFIGYANPKAEIQYINRAGRAMVGIGATEDITGVTIADLHPAWFMEQVQAQMRVGLPRDLWSTEGAFKNRSGMEIPIAMVLLAHRGADGAVGYFSTISRDIRERKRIEEEQQKFVALVANSDNFIGIAGLDQKGTFINPAGCKLVGLDSPQEIASLTIWDIVHPSVHEELRSVILPRMQSVGVWRGETLFRHRKTGAAIAMEMSGFVVKQPQSEKPLCIATVAQDITQRKQTECELTAERDFAHTLVESMPGIVYVIDETGKLLRWNRNAELVTGYSAAEIATMSPLDFFDPTDKPRIHESIKKVFEEGKADIEAHYRTRSGQSIPYFLTGLRLVWRGRPCLIGVGIDISEQKLAEANITTLNAHLKQRAAELETALAESEEFAYAAAHNLRSPLRGIDGFCLAVLEDDGDRLSTEGRSHLERVRQAGQTMGGLVDELLKLSRLNRKPMKRQSTDLSALARSLADELRQLAPERQVTFVIADGLSAECDGSLLRAALEELLANAWKFTAPHARARIEFGVERQPDQTLAYFVRDDGVGFDMAYADKLFVPFQHLHAPEEFAGQGVGLTTVQRIVLRHGGRTWAHGEVEHGATFYFTL